jgi:CubicO group peptidase (beta-lactamase class C family)
MRVNDYLQQIIARPLNSEIWFGIPADTESQVAQLKSDNAPIPQNLETGSPDYWGARAMSYGAAFITNVDAMSGGYNDPRVHAMSLPGAGGITSASAIAKIYSACITETDGVRLINDETIKNAISRPNPGDNIFNHPQPHPIHSLGFIISNPVHSPTLSETTFGHDGLGGQQGFADPETGISFGYITNWIPMVADGMARHREITRTLIQTISANS